MAKRSHASPSGLGVRRSCQGLLTTWAAPLAKVVGCHSGRWTYTINIVSVLSIVCYVSSTKYPSRPGLSARSRQSPRQWHDRFRLARPSYNKPHSRNHQPERRRKGIIEFVCINSKAPRAIPSSRRTLHPDRLGCQNRCEYGNEPSRYKFWNCQGHTFPNLPGEGVVGSGEGGIV